MRKFLIKLGFLTLAVACTHSVLAGTKTACPWQVRCSHDDQISSCYAIGGLDQNYFAPSEVWKGQVQSRWIYTLTSASSVLKKDKTRVSECNYMGGGEAIGIRFKNVPGVTLVPIIEPQNKWVGDYESATCHTLGMSNQCIFEKTN